MTKTKELWLDSSEGKNALKVSQVQISLKPIVFSCSLVQVIFSGFINASLLMEPPKKLPGLNSCGLIAQKVRTLDRCHKFRSH